MASGTRTAPDLTGTPTAKRISWKVQGINDNKAVSHSLLVNFLATDAQLEAQIVAIQALSTATIFEVTVSEVYSGTRSKSNATGDGRPSVDDKLTLTTKSVTAGNTRQVVIPAPVSDIFEPNSENLQLTDPLIVALKDATDAIDGSYEPVWINFVEYSETNTKQTF